MGGFAVVVPRRETLSDADVRRVIEASAKQAPDGVDHVLTPDGVLIVQCGFANTPCSVRDVGVRVNAEKSVWLAKRGYLTNPDEVRRRVLASGRPPHPLKTDSDLMLAAYLTWGPELAQVIQGEFALAVWDARTQQLHVINDHLGQKGCFVHDGDAFYIAASDIDQLLAVGSVPRTLDPYAVVDAISGAPVSRDRTWFASIRRQWPATVCTVTRLTSTTEMYWRPAFDTESGANGPSEWVDLVFHEFERAVRATMRTSGAVMCELSGGLDSSTIFGVAARQHARGEVPAPFFAVSRVYPGLECDESRYIDAMLAKWPTPWKGIDARPAALREPDDSTDPVEAEWAWLRECGATAVLRGYGGDELFATAPLPLEWQLIPRRHGGRYVWWSSGRNARHLAVRLRRELIRPIVPQRLVTSYLRARGRYEAPGAEDMLAPRARQMIVELKRDAGRFVRSRQEELAMEMLWDPPTMTAAQFDDGYAVSQGTETRHPFLDRSFIDLILGTPREVHVWEGKWRALQKLAFAQVLAPEVAARVDKAEFTLVRQSALEDRADAGIERLSDLGLVRPDKVRLAVESSGPATLGSHANQVRWQLADISAVEGIVRRHFGP